MRTRSQLRDIASFAKGEQINGDELISDGDYEYLNGGIAPSGKWNTSNVNGNTVTISEGGNSCGYVNYMRRPFWCGAHCYYLYDLRVDSEYLYFMLKSQQSRLMRIRTGACMPNIKKVDLGKFVLEFDTDIRQQRGIVTILKCIESIVQWRRHELQRLDELIKARFVEMFGEPNSNSMGWPMRKLGDCLSSIDGGKSLNCDNHPRNGDFPAVLKLSAVTYGTYNPRENKQLPKASDFIEDLAVHAGDLLFSRKNTYELVGMAAYVWETPPFLMLPDLIFRLNTNGTCRKVYLWQLINHPQFRKVIRGLANGSTGSMPNIAKQRLIEVSIPLPPVDRQIELEDFVSQVDKSKVVVQKWQEITGFQ